MSRHFDVREENQLEGGIRAAVSAAKRGELVVVPTENCYGLATDAFNEQGLERLRTVKGRGPELPIPVMVPSTQTVTGILTGIDQTAITLMDNLWPGALTLIGNSQPSLLWSVAGSGSNAVSVRMPLHPIALELTCGVGPLALTAANPAGADAPLTSDEAFASFGKDVAVYLDAGPRPSGPGSTMVDVTGTNPIVLRQGALSIDAIRALVPDVEVAV